MSYTPITDFSAKDALVTGNPLKIIMGADFDAEFTAIEGEFTAQDARVTDIETNGAVLGANTFTGDQTLGNNNLKTIKTATFNSEVELSTTTGAVTVNWTAAQHYKQNEPTGAITYSFTAPNGPCHLQLRLISDGTSSAYTHVFPVTVTWLGSTWSQVANKSAIINFWYDGTTYWAMGANQV